MTLTSNNKKNFKHWLKEYKGMFGPNDIVQDYMGTVNTMLTSSSSGVTSNLGRPVNIVLWNHGETIDLTGNLIEGEYTYFPAVAYDQVVVKNNAATVTLNFDQNGLISGKSLGDEVTIGDKKIVVKGIGGTLVQTQVAPTYSVSESSTNVNEGDTVTFTITTTNVPNGTSLYWNTTGTVEAEDFSDNTLSGLTTVNNNTATITRTIINDYSVSEGAENFALQISEAGVLVVTSNTVNVADTSAATYSISGSNTVVEGNTVTYTVNTTGVPDGTSLYYTVNLSSTDVTPLTGSFSITSNTGTFTLTAKQDLTVESDETLTVNIRIVSTSGPIVATMNTIIEDTAFTIGLTPAATSINESPNGGTTNIVINVATSGVADGTVLTSNVVASSGSTITFGDGGDFSNQTKTFTINSNVGVITIPVLRDGKTEGAEKIIVQVLNADGVIIAYTPEITINDTSYIGKNHIGKTFGPIHVNRDGGLVSNASDWYTICGLDSLPDGSKVAIFVDTSGSMTMQTVQASYDQLIAKLQARSMDVITVTNPSEDWITPFDQILT
tara:strand:- start:9117 stop:10775 length:1659 start_codon:yes stop_codon:yes gene_type:complete